MAATATPRSAGSAGSSAPRSPACSCARSSTSRRTGARRRSRRRSSRRSTCSRSASASARSSSTVGGYDYVEFVGTGTVATAVLFSSAFPAMFGTFVKYQFQRTYDAILAAPVDTEELVTAEALWIATRAERLRLRADARRDRLRSRSGLGDADRAVHRVVAGFGWACFGIAVAGFAKSIENFNYVISAVLTPLFLVAGTFFPLERPAPLGADRCATSTRCTTASSSSATPPSASTAGPTSPASACSSLFGARHVARRDLRDDTQADRLAPWDSRASTACRCSSGRRRCTGSSG